jgi:hypothetical protein
MSTPGIPFVTMVPQRYKTDCGVSTLAMLCGVTYERAVLAIGETSVMTAGVQLRKVRDAARKLGKRLVLRRKVDPDNDTGILGVVSDQWDFEHLVILKEGTIIDAQDQTVWDFDTYLQVHGARVVSLLALREDT